MKLKNFKVLFAAAAMFVAAKGFAQETNYNDPAFAKYGETAEIREKNFKAYSFFLEETKNRNHALASVYLKQLLTDLPKVSVNLYIKGATMYKQLLMKERAADRREVYVDSLMTVYDLRAEHFPNLKGKGANYIAVEKVKDLIRYKANDKDAVIAMMHKGVEEHGTELDAAIIPVYYNYLATLYANDAVETSVILAEFELVSDLLVKSTDPKKEEYVSQIEKLFLGSGAASAENLEALFKPQYEADPTNVDLIAKILRQLKAVDCRSDFQVLLSEKYYEIEPTADAAIILAKTFAEKKEIEKSNRYYDEAIAKTEDNVAKLNLTLSVAGGNLVAGRVSDAIAYTKKAIAVDGQSGLAYFILAQAQAQSITCGDEFQKQAAFWLIVDNLNIAKKYIDPAQVAKVTESINLYSQNFPTAEEIFFRELQEGGSFTVNCGAVTGTTTIRKRK